MTEVKTRAGCCRLFAMEVNTIYRHVPNGDNLVVLFSDRPTSKLSSYSIITPLHAARTRTHVLTHTRTHSRQGGSGVKSCDARELYIVDRLQFGGGGWGRGGGESSKYMKKHEAAAVSMEQKKQSRKMSTTNSCWFLLPQATWTLVPSCFFPPALCIIFSSN